ncbi:hypothetical protein CTAYLR_010207 [Chrysophaeum taylorii]|uniref:Nucleotide-diphospho-sugar transferase domain-containing protein n=1 Tax=Chrysophaeum taylorii TaxID=2483200 RepID=A0AAD7UKM1_9STRA|nr:hypothetical protein CTAYLR_010207 [Chrysophaeum taylorii]
MARVVVLELELDGESTPLAFTASDNLTARAMNWVAAHPRAGKWMTTQLEQLMANKLASQPAPVGEDLGCPAFRVAPSARLDNNTFRSSLDAVARRALEISSQRIVISMVSQSYANFGASLARSLDLVSCDEYLIVALDDGARDALAHVGRRVVVAATSTSAGRDQVETYGSNGFRRVTIVKPAIVRRIHTTGLHVLYTDADVVFVRNPWSRLLGGCSVQVQPVGFETNVVKALRAWEVDPRNPRPFRHYYAKAVCSGLTYFAARDEYAEILLDRWQERAQDPNCGGDQVALEAAAASVLDETRLCGLGLHAFPHGMALKALGIEAALLDEERHGDPPTLPLPRRIDDPLVAIHFNYVIGGDAKRDWANRLGLWFNSPPNTTDNVARAY